MSETEVFLPSTNNSKSTRMSKSQMKKVLITFFNFKYIIHFEFIPQGQRVNQIYYVDVLKRLHETVLSKIPENWPDDWILHFGNATTHEVLSVEQFLAKNSLMK
jgi:hypothetical protein